MKKFIILDDVEFEILTKKEVAAFMQDKNKDEYCMELFAPHCYKYNEKLLDNDSLYYINGNEVTLLLEETLEALGLEV